MNDRAKEGGMNFTATYNAPAAPLIQWASDHHCIACGEQYPACCGQCIKFVPEEGHVPCATKCGHWVCNEGLAEYRAEREITTS